MRKEQIKTHQRSGYHPRERERLLDALAELLRDDPNLGKTAEAEKEDERQVPEAQVVPW